MLDTDPLTAPCKGIILDVTTPAFTKELTEVRLTFLYLDSCRTSFVDTCIRPKAYHYVFVVGRKSFPSDICQ